MDNKYFDSSKNEEKIDNVNVNNLTGEDLDNVNGGKFSPLTKAVTMITLGTSSLSSLGQGMSAFAAGGDNKVVKQTSVSQSKESSNDNSKTKKFGDCGIDKSRWETSKYKVEKRTEFLKERISKKDKANKNTDEKIKDKIKNFNEVTKENIITNQDNKTGISEESENTKNSGMDELQNIIKKSKKNKKTNEVSDEDLKKDRQRDLAFRRKIKEGKGKNIIKNNKENKKEKIKSQAESVLDMQMNSEYGQENNVMKYDDDNENKEIINNLNLSNEDINEINEEDINTSHYSEPFDNEQDLLDYWKNEENNMVNYDALNSVSHGALNDLNEEIDNMEVKIPIDEDSGFLAYFWEKIW